MRARVSIVSSLVALGVLVAAVSAWAHVDPPGCAGNFVTVGIRIFRADDLDAAGWAGGFAEVTADTTFLVIVVA